MHASARSSRIVHSNRKTTTSHALASEAQLDELNAQLAVAPADARADPSPQQLSIGVKDNICTAGTRTTAGSAALARYVPVFDASCVARLRASGHIIACKTNLDEFAMGSSTELSAFGITRNPSDRSRVPGGSSGGSAAAVASGLVHASLGSDSGGSIRQPAAFCGCVGLKPSYGRVPRHGLIAYASSLDTVGPIASSVADCAFLLDTMAGPDDFDSTALPSPPHSFSSALSSASDSSTSKPLEGTVLGVLDFTSGIDEQVKAAVDNAAKELERLGATLETVTMPSIEDGLAAYHVIAPSEASSNLARYDGMRFGSRTWQAASHSLPASDMELRPLERASLREGESANGAQHDATPTLAQAYAEARSLLGAEVTRRVLTGTYTLSTSYADVYYNKAQQVRSLVQQELEQILSNKAALVMPTTPTEAFGIGEKREDPLAMLAGDVLTAPANLSGAPAISVPCGKKDGLPLGMQLLSRPEGEHDILRIAHAYEQRAG